MGLFSTSSRQKVVDDVENLRKSKRSYRRRRNTDPARLRIDIGEPTPLEISLRNVQEFVVMKESGSSACIKVSYDNGKHPEVIMIKWSRIIRDANPRDHIAALLAKSITSVPSYRVREVFKHHKKYVGVGIRSYIPGRTLRSQMHLLSADEIESISLQVQVLSWQLAKKRSMHFGHIQDGAFRTQTPVGYIRTRVFFDRLANVMDASDWSEQGRDCYTSDAIMCHGDLSPEHIILDGTDVVGLVGWSRGDFVPEVYDRLMYYFRSDPTNPKCWYRQMSEMLSHPESGKPSVEFVINTTRYVYKRMWREADPTRRCVLNSLWKAITSNYTLINCLSTATQTESDSMSLDSLSTWCEDSDTTET